MRKMDGASNLYKIMKFIWVYIVLYHLKRTHFSNPGKYHTWISTLFLLLFN